MPTAKSLAGAHRADREYTVIEIMLNNAYDVLHDKAGRAAYDIACTAQAGVVNAYRVMCHCYQVSEQNSQINQKMRSNVRPSPYMHSGFLGFLYGLIRSIPRTIASVIAIWSVTIVVLGYLLANEWAAYTHRTLHGPVDYIDAAVSALKDKEFMSDLKKRIGVSSSNGAANGVFDNS
jgi:hypothetical protein